MSTDAEQNDGRQDPADYEKPSTVIGDTPKITNKGDRDKQTGGTEEKQQPALKGAKKWLLRHVTPMNLLTLVIAAAAWAQYRVTQGQLIVMQGQLDEGKRSGQIATQQMWSAIGNMNWMATTTDESLKQAGRAIEESRKRSIADQRPYVTIHTSGTIRVLPERPLEFNVQLINWGKTLALNVTIVAAVWFGEGIEQSINRFFSDAPSEHPGRVDDMYLIPNIGNGDAKSPSFEYTTITSAPRSPSDKAITFITSHEGGARVAGRCWYKDTYGKWYHTDFCYMTLLSGAVSTCPHRNEIH